MDYYSTLKEIHRIFRPRTYVEIGVRHGESFRLARAGTRCVGIDPALDMRHPYAHGSKLFRMTSDEFFERHDLRETLGGLPADLAFIDGMHLFEYALRDFINIEKHCHEGSCILVHDCLPLDRETSSRERRTRVWTGDVWKLVPCLKKYRPDLSIKTIDAAPTGLAVITGLDPSSRTLGQNIEEIYDRYVPLDYGRIENNKREALSVVEDGERGLDALLPGHRARVIRRIVKGASRLGAIAGRGRPRCLGVLLCYNDGDILEDMIAHFVKNRHDIIAWDHGSDDETPDILDKYEGLLVERRYVPRSFDFYRLYPEMSQNLIENYAGEYDWISWPDDDEILEGPDRRRSYYEHVCDVYRSPYNYIEFNNVNYWFTAADDPGVPSPVGRIRHYSLFPDCAPRIRSWRASVTNIREFNHNPMEGKKYPARFNLRHYPMRSAAQTLRRITKDRAGIKRGPMNYHYDHMRSALDKTDIGPERLHYDDGESELCLDVKFNWREIYGMP